jgi:FAD/FMN-containing dehydrogenase
VPETTTIDVASLRSSCKAEILSSDDPGYDQARRAFNLMIDQRPTVVALPADADDVAEIVRFARAHGKQASDRSAP